MSGPYVHQEAHRHTETHVTGPGVVPPPVHVGGLGVGPPALHAGGLGASQFAGQIAGMPHAQYGALAPGQTVTQTTSMHRTADVVQNRRPVAARQRRADSSSSSSVSERYRVGGATEGSVGGSSHQQYSADSGYGAGCVPNQQRRQGRYQKQVIRLPDQPQGPARQVRRRMPTPEPDTLERVYIQRVAGEVIEEITEVPTTPPPRVQERTVCEPAGPPQVIRKVIRVPPRGSGGGGYQQAASFVGNANQSSNLLSAGSYGSVQQAAGSYQQYGSYTPPAATTSYSGGYGAGGGGYGSYGGGYQQQQQPSYAYGGGYQQQQPSYGYGGGYQQQQSSYGYGGGYQQQPTHAYGGYASQPVAPSVGLHQATCFYV